MMSSMGMSLVAFAFVFGGAVLGMILRARLPKNHLIEESKETVKVAMGLVATMTAIVLGMLISSAKRSYDTQSDEMTEISSKIVGLDRVLAHYGPEGEEVRGVLRTAAVRLIDRVWSNDPANLSQVPRSPEANTLFDKIEGLSPKDDRQRWLKAEGLNLSISLAETRWLIYYQRFSSVSMPLVIMLVFWLSLIFTGFGLFSPPNATAITSLFVSALSVSGAILLILEMYTPFAGLIRISDVPMRAALASLGQ
jgi:hypothetical protein